MMTPANWMHIIEIAAVVFVVMMWSMTSDVARGRRECKLKGHQWQDNRCTRCFRRLE